MEDSSNEKALATTGCISYSSLTNKTSNESSHSIDFNNNSLEKDQGKLVSKLNTETSVSIPLAHWPLQGPITTVNLTESTPNGSAGSYFLMHAPIDLISASASLSQSSKPQSSK